MLIIDYVIAILLATLVTTILVRVALRYLEQQKWRRLRDSFSYRKNIQKVDQEIIDLKKKTPKPWDRIETLEKDKDLWNQRLRLLHR